MARLSRWELEGSEVPNVDPKSAVTLIIGSPEKVPLILGSPPSMLRFRV